MVLLLSFCTRLSTSAIKMQTRWSRSGGKAIWTLSPVKTAAKTEGGTKRDHNPSPNITWRLNLNSRMKYKRLSRYHARSLCIVSHFPLGNALVTIRLIVQNANEPAKEICLVRATLLFRRDVALSGVRLVIKHANQPSKEISLVSATPHNPGDANTLRVLDECWDEPLDLHRLFSLEQVSSWGSSKFSPLRLAW